MGRTKGTYILTSNIEPKVGAPLDARTVVPLKTDLTASGTFDYPYIGLSVFVREDNKRYTLIGMDPTVVANWREEGSGTSTSADHVTYDNRESGLESVNIQDAVDEIVNDLGSAAYKDVPESGNADLTQVVMGNDSRLTDGRNANDVYPWAKSVNKPTYTYSEIQNTPTLGTAAAKDYTTSVTEDSTDLITSGAVYDALENIPSDDTWRNIKVNGTEKLGTANTTGAVDFINGTNTTVSFDTIGNKIKIDAVDTKYTFTDGTNGFTVTPSSGSSQIVKVTPSIADATTSASGLMSASDKTKLDGIATGAEANVQSDWNQTTITADDYIKNKPTLGTAAAKDIPTTGNADNTQVVMGSDTRLTDSRPASDVYDWAKAATKPTYTKSEVGLGNVDNTSDATKKTNFTGSISSGNTGFITGGDAYTALNSKLNTSLKGAANGLAELDADGKVPSSQLPSYVDDVIEAEDYAHLPITGVSGKIYVTLDTNLTYRWSGTGYTEISASLALGETSSTAYRGDRGKTAYNHAAETKLSTATASGLYKVAGTAQGHIASLTAVQKSDITALGIPGSDTNTTYTFEGGTNSFKVTPSGASAQTVIVTPSIADATTSASGLMSASDKTKLNGIATGAEVNQNAFSNVKVGSTTIAADSKTDTLELVAGSNITLTPDATNDKITIAATDTNTTYTFAGGTNKFTVTPSGGTAQDVTITPSIANNITGSGTSGYLTKFNGTNTITNGPQLGSSTTTYLRNDGSWATPTDTNNRKSFYGTCDTAAGTAAKVVTLADTAGWELKAGTIVGVKCTNSNTAGNATLNVNGSGDKSIFYEGAVYTGSTSWITGQAGRVIFYMYDGTYWVWMNFNWHSDGNNTVTQNATTTNADYEILFSATADNTTRTEQARKNNNFKFNPSLGKMSVIGLGKSWLDTGKNPQMYLSKPSNDGAVGALGIDTKDGRIVIGAYPSANNQLTFSYFTNTTLTGTNNKTDAQMFWEADDDDLHVTKINNVTVGSSPKFTDTTYTFANGTNGFTVTPSGGTAQTITVTPSIANNITGSGTNGYIAKFNGTNTITNGPAFGSATTTYLRNDGSWATPTDTNTHRPIQMNGTEILGNNTTALNLKAGSNVSLTNSSGTVTIAATDTNTTYTVATGDSNGQIKVTPSSGSAYNVAVKGLGSNAYTSTAYLPLAGGTVTDNVALKRSTINAQASNNGLSSGQEYPTTFNILDKNNLIMVRNEGIISSDGSIAGYWYVRNYNGSTTQVAQKGIKMSMNKSGTLTYTVDDAANFRSAISAAASSHTHPINQVTWAGGQNLTPSASANNAEWSIDLSPGSYTGTYFHIYSAKNSKSILQCFTDTNEVVIPSGNLKVTGGKTYNRVLADMLTGTGTAAQDKGSGVSPRYFPAKWAFNIGIATPADGDIVTIKIPVAGHDFGTFLSLDNGTTYKPISVDYGTGRLTTHYAVNRPITLIYDASGGTNSVYAAAGADARSNITGGCWRVMNFWDSGNTYDRNRFNANIMAWGTKILNGNIIVGINGLYHHLKEGTAFDITYPILYLAGDCNASAATTNTYDIIHFISTTTQNTSWTAYKPVYIKGSLSGNTFTPISTTPLLQTIPTSEDNYYYMLLGMATSGTTIYLQDRHPIFAYRFNNFTEITFNANYTSFLKPVSSTTTTWFSNWAIPSGSYQVWGQQFKDSRLTYTPSGGSATVVTDTGDWTMWLSGNGTTNTATLNMRIDGTFYASTFSGNLSGNASSANTSTTARQLQWSTVRMTTPNTHWNDAALRYYLSSSSMTTDKPRNLDGKIIHMPWDNDGGYASQMFVAHGQYALAALRCQNGNKDAWGSWMPMGVFSQTTPTSGQVVITDGTNGMIKSSGYTIATSVPSGAVFTDTKNTAGSTDTSSKIFLIGATSQAANPQTYSDNEVYATSGVLTTKSVQVGGTAATMQYNSTNHCIDFIVT